jgi:hypothetical protein
MESRQIFEWDNDPGAGLLKNIGELRKCRDAVAYPNGKDRQGIKI